MQRRNGPVPAGRGGLRRRQCKRAVIFGKPGRSTSRRAFAHSGRRAKVRGGALRERSLPLLRDYFAPRAAAEKSKNEAD